MLTTISKMECIIDGKRYMFYCDTDSPITSCKEALFQFQKFVGQIEDNAKKAQEELDKKAQEELDKKEEDKECSQQE